MEPHFDLIVIGAGPGGYVAAIRAAQLGLRVAVVEKGAVGGVCLNWGCIPSKHLIHQAEVFRSMEAMESVGVSIDRSGFDYEKVHQGSRQVVRTLTGGVSGLLNEHNVTMVEGTARLTAPGEVSVRNGDDIVGLTADHVLVATGSRPMTVPGFEFDESVVLSSNGILAMTSLPTTIVIVGGGAIGCEFAYVLSSFGVEVTLVELADHLLPTEDFETCAVLERSFVRDGIKVMTSTRAVSLRTGDNSAQVAVEGADGATVLEADRVLVVLGRVPNTEDLGLAEVGVELDDRGYVMVGDYGETTAKGIFAIGDVTSSPALAHVASKEGEIAVEHMAGRDAVTSRVAPELVPSAVYCEPQVAGFGLREDTARAEGVEVKVSVFPYRGAGKTIAVGKPDGLVKLLCDPETGEILGGHIVGHDATELVHELLLAKSSELLPGDIANMIHAHPTVSEAVMEAARGIDGLPVHA
ncbi:MAG: dihydrolipoyl dehydrogenase [Actinomycetia bacterium]|nr:dihydrolipoyl dehydrogenase [Actinomycetes bacterium]